MVYTAIGLLLLGFAVGVISRLSILLLVVILMVPASILFAQLQGLRLLDGVLTLVVAQTIVQLSFVLGLATRAIVYAIFARWTATQPPRSPG